MYNVPAKVQPFIDDFIEEAQQRGINLVIDDLVVEFDSNLEVDGNQAAGICRRSRNKPPTILLDTTTVNWSSNLSAREQLVFHELGHCVLDLSHVSDRLTDGNYVTLMRPTGEQLYGAELSAFKREYYLDRLFDGNATAPSWSFDVPRFNDLPGDLILDFVENFNNNSNGWPTGESNNSILSFLTGIYIMEVKSPGNYFVGNTLNIDPTRDFDLQFSVKIEGNGFAGVLWAGGDDGGAIPSYNTFFFDNDVISIGTIRGGTESSYVYPEYLTDEFNDVSIRHIDGQLMFYVNEELVDHMEFRGVNGNEFGLSFGGPTGVIVRFDRIVFSYIN